MQIPHHGVNQLKPSPVVPEYILPTPQPINSNSNQIIPIIDNICSIDLQLYYWIDYNDAYDLLLATS